MPEPSFAPIAENLLKQVDDGILLVAARDRETGRTVFPPKAVEDHRYDRITLPREGRLWSWTVQRFRPKSPPYAGSDAFAPYAVGYVELDGALIVESRLVDVAFDGLRIGMPMRLVPLTFALASGEQRTTFAFAPTGEARS